MRRLVALPLFVLLIGLAALAMLIPAFHAAALRDWDVARAFLQPALLGLVLAAVLGIATAPNRRQNPARGQLMTLLIAYTALPALLAVPFLEAVPGTGFGAAWWEMLSAFTTTGATLFKAADLPLSVHLWRALAAWLGGLFALSTAAAILAPMNLGGFELLTGAPAGRGAVGTGQILRVADPAGRLARAVVAILPLYAGATGLLWMILVLLGDPPVVGLCHAMSAFATAGITPLPSFAQAPSGIAGEAAVFLALFFALSRRLYPVDRPGLLPRGIGTDPEVRLAAVVVGAVTTLLVLRHWVASFDDPTPETLESVLRAIWGSAFTALSFLTTNGFASSAWAETQAWSGLSAAGLVLAGLATFGGGVATTAGGVKLLRVYALYRHGEREVERLIHPSSVGGAGVVERRLRQRGARLAWIFFMIFALSICLIMLALSLDGLDFQQATVLTVAALSNTGPLAEIATETPVAWTGLGVVAQVILAAAMVLGRLETLAIIALLNPEFWRG